MSAMRDQVSVTGLQPPESQTRLCCRAVATRMPYAIPRTWWISEPAKKLLETLGTGLETLSQQAAIFHYGALQLFASSSRHRNVTVPTSACADGHDGMRSVFSRTRYFIGTLCRLSSPY